MEYRPLGGSGFQVPVLTLGTGTCGGGSDFFRAWGSAVILPYPYWHQRGFAARNPGVKGLRASERMGLVTCCGHRNIMQVAPSLEASPYNAAKQRTACDPGKLIAF